MLDPCLDSCLDYVLDYWFDSRLDYFRWAMCRIRVCIICLIIVFFLLNSVVGVVGG